MFGWTGTFSFGWLDCLVALQATRAHEQKRGWLLMAHIG